MSRRFGRQQKRKFREELKSLNKQVSELKEQVSSERGARFYPWGEASSDCIPLNRVFIVTAWEQITFSSLYQIESRFEVEGYVTRMDEFAELVNCNTKFYFRGFCVIVVRSSKTSRSSVCEFQSYSLELRVIKEK